MREITETAARVLAVERVGVWWFDDSRSKIRCVHSFELSRAKHGAGGELASEEYPAYFAALEEERTIAAADAHVDPRTMEFSRTYLTPLGISSMLDVPVRVAGRMAGIVCHEHVGVKRVWTVDEEAFAAGVASLVALAVETEARHRAETDLKGALSELEATLESTADGILVVDRNGRVTRFNRKFVELWRIPEELVATRDDERLLGFVLDQLDDAEVFLRKVRELYAQPEAESFDVLPFKDGRLFERYSQPQRVGSDVVGRVWSFRDVTKRKAAEDALREQMGLYHSLLSTMSDFGMGMCIREGERFVYVNDAFCRIAGRSREELLAVRSFLDLLSPQDREVFSERLRARRDAGRDEEHYAAPIHGTDGRRRHVQVAVKRLPGAADRYVSLFQDVTDQREAEERMRRAEKMAAMGLLVAGVAHDVNNPLAVARSNNDLILESSSEPTVRKLATTNAQAMRRIEATVRRLQRLAAPQAPRRIPTDLRPILADAARLVGDQFAGRCTVDVEVDGLPLVPCDPDLVADAVTNLVLNAAEASPRGGRVVVRARPEGRDVVLTVEDEGPGLPAEVLARLFEPFFTTKPQGNMGLGLVLARSVIEDHGGRIEAANRAQGGAVLTVHLPLETLP